MIRPAVFLALALLSCQASAGRPQMLGKDPVRPLPVVLWHGMGDSCCDQDTLGGLAQFIGDKLGVFVHSIATGQTEFSDVWSSFYGNVNDQVAAVCAELRNITELHGGYNAVGFSQGGQFLRAVAERCQHTGPRMHTLVTMGGQHQGVVATPGCNMTSGTTASVACRWAQKLVGKGAYLPWIRDNVVQAQYFKDPLHLDAYLLHNAFLADVNNERPAGRSAQYADNLASLDKLVLVRFEEDTTVVPRDSAWFSVLDANLQLLPLREQPLYTEDWIGLRRLDEAGGLFMDTAPGPHMRFTNAWFQENVMFKYLAAPPRPQRQRRLRL